MYCILNSTTILYYLYYCYGSGTSSKIATSTIIIINISRNTDKRVINSSMCISSSMIGISIISNFMSINIIASTFISISAKTKMFTSSSILVSSSMDTNTVNTIDNIVSNTSASLNTTIVNDVGVDANATIVNNISVSAKYFYRY